MKRISLLVIGVHVALLLWMALWMPVKKIEKKPLQIRTVMEVTTPKPAPAPVPIKKAVAVVKQAPPKPKKVVKKIKKAPVKKAVKQKPKAPIIPDALLRQVQESIAKIEAKDHKKVVLKKPLKLQIDEESGGRESIYTGLLIQCLQNALELPEIGTVKMELTLKRDGTLVKTRVLQSGSNRNRNFLETELASLKFPAFSGPHMQEKEHAFVITFCNN